MLTLLTCYTTADCAPAWQSFCALYLADISPYQVHTKVLDTPQQVRAAINQTPSISALEFNTKGLWLWHGGLTIAPDWISEIPRLRKANLRNEQLARACQLALKPTIIDATAGLGHDSLLMAWLGASHIDLHEQNPWLYLLLQSSKQTTMHYAQLKGYQRLITALQVMHIHFANSITRMQTLVSHAATVDVVYLDPMFPKPTNSKKQAQVKKHMQVLQQLLSIAHDNAIEQALLSTAQQLATRVVVKRPSVAPPLAEQPPTHQWKGDSCRFDAYFNSTV